MSKYLAFIAALPLAVMPLPMVFMIISAVHEPAGAEYGEASAIVRQETTAPDVSTSDATLDKTRKIQFNTDRPKQLQKNPNPGRRDAYRRRRTQRRIPLDPSQRKQIVVPQGLNDAYAS